MQIREEKFYKENNKDLELTVEEYIRIRTLCSSLGIPFGLALGPIVDLEWLLVSELNPDFIKLIYKATNNLDFVKRINQHFKCEKYFSVGLAEDTYIREQIIPFMGTGDMIIHTSLSHEAADQNLLDINRMKDFGKDVCFGQHALGKEVCFAAIGAGARKIFVYIGDKNLDLPDYGHAIASSEAVDFYNQCLKCFSAMEPIAEATKTSKINFIG